MTDESVTLDFLGRQVKRMQTDQRFMREELETIRHEVAAFKEEMRDDLDALRKEAREGFDVLRKEQQEGFRQVLVAIESIKP